MKKQKYVYVLQTCNADMTSRDGFKWPKKGTVECQDWSPTAKCGNGLHGLLWGCGDKKLLNWGGSAKWLVVKVLKDQVIDLDGKVKFPKGEVVFCGSRKEAIETIQEFGAPFNCVSSKVTVGDGENAIVCGEGTAIAGDYGAAIAGYEGMATAGYRGMAVVGRHGIATTGKYGSSMAGEHGVAIAGDHGTATAGYGGTVTVGNGGTIIIKWAGEIKSRIAVGYIGEKGLKPNTKYKCDKNGNFVEVEK